VGIFAALRGDYIQSLDPAVAMGFREADAGVVAKSLVLEHEADQLGLSATDEERLAALTSLPAFRDQEGKFDPARFNEFKQKALNAQGFSDADFDQIFLTGEVRARKLREIASSTVAVAPDEVRDHIIQERTKTEASVIPFRREEFRKDLKATDEELKKRYEEQKDLFKTPEQRKVRYAAFTLPPPPDGKPLEEKVRNAELQKLAAAAYAFREELETTKGNFAELAKKHGGTVGETKEFFTSENVPAELEGSPEVAEAALALTKEKPHSPHLILKNGTYVLEFMETKAPEQRPFESVKAELEKQVTSAKADELARTKATETRTKLAEAMKGGKSFADAAKELNLKVEPQPAFGNAERAQPGEFGHAVLTAASKLAPGQISEVVPSSNNDAFLIVDVDYRSPVDEKEIDAARPMVERQLEARERYSAYNNWLAERGRAAGLDKAFPREANE
jgi:peptidyl-prolyl cis-trans isomerase D